MLLCFPELENTLILTFLRAAKYNIVQLPVPEPWETGEN